MSRSWGIFVVAALIASGCAAAESSDPGATSSTSSQIAGPEVTSIPVTPPTPSPSTVAPSTAPPLSTAPPPVTFPLAESVSFLDGCISGAGSGGPCRCALSAVAGLVAVEDLATLEDRFVGTAQLPLVIQDAITGCEEAQTPDLDLTLVGALASECTLGDSRLAAPCQCAAERAVQIVPAVGLAEWSNRTDIDPSLIDLLNRCLEP